MSATRRRLPALAVLLAVVLLGWGIASGVSLWVQVSETDYDLYEGSALAVLLLHNTAAFFGAWVVLWALFGLGWRPPLHISAILVLVSVIADVIALVVVDRELGLAVGDQLEYYLDAALGEYGGEAFWTAAPLVFAPFVLVLWLLVLVSGAGRKVAVGYAPQPGYYPQQHYPQPSYPQPSYPQPSYPQPSYPQAAPQQAYPPQPAYRQPAPPQPGYQPPPQQAYQQPPPHQAYQQPAAQQHHAPRPAPVVPQPPPENRTLILPPDNPAVWFAVVAGQQSGPFTLAELHSQLRTGQLSRDTEVRREQGAPVPLGQLLGV